MVFRNHLKAFLVVMVVGFFLGYGVYSYLNSIGGGATQVHGVFEKLEREGLPEFQVKDLRGRSLLHKDLEGKLIILNFWASWCGPCVEELPSLIKLIKKFEGKVLLVAISGDSQKEDMEAFLKAFPEMTTLESIYIVHENYQGLMKTFEVSKLPESYIFDLSLKAIKKVSGSIDWFSEEAQAYIESHLKASSGG